MELVIQTAGLGHLSSASLSEFRVATFSKMQALWDMVFMAEAENTCTLTLGCKATMEMPNSNQERYNCQGARGHKPSR